MGASCVSWLGGGGAGQWPGPRWREDPPVKCYSSVPREDAKPEQNLPQEPHLAHLLEITELFSGRAEPRSQPASAGKDLTAFPGSLASSASAAVKHLTRSPDAGPGSRAAGVPVTARLDTGRATSLPRGPRPSPELPSRPSHRFPCAVRPRVRVAWPGGDREPRSSVTGLLEPPWSPLPAFPFPGDRIRASRGARSHPGPLGVAEAPVHCRRL